MAIDPSVRARVFMGGLVRSARAARRRSDRGAVVPLIAVHDEEEQVEVAIRSLKAEESPPELHDEDAVRIVNADSMPVSLVLSEAMRRLREARHLRRHRERRPHAQLTAAAAVRTPNVRPDREREPFGSTTAG
jgi:hypothetical protein